MVAFGKKKGKVVAFGKKKGFSRSLLSANLSDLRRSSAGVNGLRRTLSRISPYRFLTEFALTNLSSSYERKGDERSHKSLLTGFSRSLAHWHLYA
ncbi:hypothetical protein H6P81_018273 [Aristolochia fimbriata]|uniref:Uncharacterized protein n=1 Tax=Aristolochia fimbriata TaxID=158543 RepID=A0AAV7E2G4_ARIFI|nr:hypothetical protein H6P81_018273 [Aristolochia fimbriata]